MAVKQALILNNGQMEQISPTDTLFDLPLVNLAPSTSQTIPSGYGVIVPYIFTIASGQTITLGLNAILQIT